MSYPALSWTARTSAADNSWNGVCWSSDLSLFCAVASSGTGNRVQTSPDGITWTARTSAADQQWNDVCWSSALALFVAVSGSGATARVQTSPDGITWTLRTTDTTHGWNGVCWSADLGLFVAVGDSSTSTNRCMTSPDGITWTLRTTPTGASFSGWKSVCWSPALTLFVAVANAGTLRCMTSPDGITWTSQSIDTAKSWQGVCWAPELSLFCAVSDIGTTSAATTSPDGITWTLRTTPNTNFWNAVAWNGASGYFIAVSSSGTGNRVMSSDDGITWTARTSAANNAWKSVCMGASEMLVAVSSSGTGNRVMTLGPVATAFSGTPGLLTLTLSGQSPWFAGDPPAILIITVTGLQPDAPMGRFIEQAGQGEIGLIGLTPSALAAGFSGTPLQGFLDWIGQLPTIITRNIIEPPPYWVAVRYRCFLTPPESTVFDIELPISSFQSRLRLNGLSYLSIVLKGADAYADQIVEAANRKMRIFREYHYLDGSINSNLIAAADYETLQIAEGGKSGVTATLSGNGDFVPTSFETIALTNPTYRSTSSSGHRYRCAIDARLRPGDTAQINGDAFTVNEIVYIVDTKTAIMEIAE
jgi:hypothetical protein